MRTVSAVKIVAIQRVSRTYRALLTTLLILLLAGAAAVLSSGLRHELALSFLRQPAQYTELYFASEQPTETIAEDELIDVSIPFTVVNHEGQPTTYRYVVQVVDDVGVPVGRTEGSAYVSDERSSTTTANVEVPASAQLTRIVIGLAGRPEHIFLGL